MNQNNSCFSSHSDVAPELHSEKNAIDMSFDNLSEAATKTEIDIKMSPI